MKKLIFSLITGITMSCHCSKPNSTTAYTQNENIPECVQKLIEQFRKEEKQNPPRQILSYQYNGNQVYYVTAPCCDFFSDLYDMNCVLIGHPDGGFTGKGDGKIPDFGKTRTDEKLIWKDERN